MANFTLSPRPGFTFNSTVTVDEVDARDRSKVVAAAVTTGTVLANGTAPLTGLTSGRTYRATCNGLASYFRMGGAIALSQVIVLSAADYAAITSPDPQTLYILAG